MISNSAYYFGLLSEIEISNLNRTNKYCLSNLLIDLPAKFTTHKVTCFIREALPEEVLNKVFRNKNDFAFKRLDIDMSNGSLFQSTKFIVSNPTLVKLL